MTLPSQAPAAAAQEAPDLGQWEGQYVPLVRPSSCVVKGGIRSSRRYLPAFLGVVVCVSGVRVLLSSPHSLLGCWGVIICVRAVPVPCQFWLELVVCLFGYRFCFHPPNPGSGVLFVCALCLYAANPGLPVRCVCLGTGFCFTSPNLAGAFSVLVWARVLLPPCQSWLGCFGVCVCVRAPPVPR